VTLSDRLERAKRERLLAAGLLHSEAALKPEDEIDVTDGRMSDEIQIEVPSAGLHAVPPPIDDTPPQRTELVADERSASCPNCRRPGKVDMVDLVGNNVHLSCPTCGTMWRATRTAG
jgi:hypothetical protein